MERTDFKCCFIPLTMCKRCQDNSKVPHIFPYTDFLALLKDNVGSVHIMFSLFLFDPYYTRYCVNYAKALCTSNAINLHKIAINIFMRIPYRDRISAGCLFRSNQPSRRKVVYEYMTVA